MGGGAPNQIRHVLERHRHPEAADDHAHSGHCIAAATACETAVEHSFDDDADDTGDDHRSHQRSEIWNAADADDRDADEGADHVHLAVREVDDVEPREDERDAERDEPVDDTDGETDDDEVQQQVHPVSLSCRRMAQ